MSNANEPAYPVQGVMYGDKIGGQLAHGMTKREAFAMAAMQGLLSGAAHWTSPYDAAEIARRSRVFADALIEALKETP